MNYYVSDLHFGHANTIKPMENDRRFDKGPGGERTTLWRGLGILK